MAGFAAALESRRFRWLLVLVAAIPIAGRYLAESVVGLITTAGQRGTTDFSDVYYPAARDILLGRDPYSEPCQGSGCFPLLGNASSFQPPAMAWLLQPLGRLDFHTADVVAILAANVCVLLVVALSLWAARIRDRQVMVLFTALVLAWSPVIQAVDNRQPQLLLAVLAAVWAAGHALRRSGGWAAGAALGLGVAVKLMLAPLFALLVWRRRWAMLAAGLLAWALLWAVGAPNLLWEYLTRVLPQVSAGTGFGHNVALAATVDRLLEPDSFWGRSATVSPLVRPITLALAAAASLVTAWRMGPDTDDPDQRLLEASAGLSLSLLLVSLLWPLHLVLLVPAMAALVAVGLRRRNGWPIVAVVAAWLLLGPIYQACLYLTMFGHRYELAIRILAESGIAGQLVLWGAAVAAMRTATAPRAQETPVVARAQV